jgi:hypothetical protein
VTTITHPAASTPAPVLQDRVGPLDAVRHTLTLAWRSLVQIRHNPMELGDLSLQPLMFVALFAFVFGGAISGSPKAFLQFGLAGIITQNALFLTMNTGVALNNDITKGVFDRFRSLPIARSAPLAGRSRPTRSACSAPWPCCWCSPAPSPGSRCWWPCWLTSPRR